MLVVNCDMWPRMAFPGDFARGIIILFAGVQPILQDREVMVSMSFPLLNLN